MISVAGYIAVEWILFAIALIVVVARISVRIWMRRSTLWASEIFLVLGLLCFLTLLTENTWIFATGVTNEELYYSSTFVRLLFVSGFAFDLGFYFPRFSLLMFYHELFPISEERLRLCLYAVSVYTTCAFFATGLVHVFWCGTDVAAEWARSSQCLLLSDPRVWYVGWSLSIASELLVFALPFGMLPTLKTLPNRDKTGLICLFLLGAITVVVSTVRFVSTTMSTIDLPTYILSWTEITTQIIIASLPPLRPLLRAITSKWSRMSNHGGTGREKFYSNRTDPFDSNIENLQTGGIS